MVSVALRRIYTHYLFHRLSIFTYNAQPINSIALSTTGKYVLHFLKTKCNRCNIFVNLHHRTRAINKNIPFNSPLPDLCCLTLLQGYWAHYAIETCRLAMTNDKQKFRFVLLLGLALVLFVLRYWSSWLSQDYLLCPDPQVLMAMNIKHTND